jgi:hypothetical protein
MTRRQDLESHIRASYILICEYEDILRISDRPKEKARARRNIREQWGLIDGYLNEYLSLCERQGASLPSDVQEIAARFENKSAEPASNVSESSLGDAVEKGSKYSIQIKHAEGLAIGDGAQVIQSSSPQRRKPTDAARGDTYPHSASQAPPGPIKDRWTLLLGVNRYVDPAFPPLKFCVNDVLALEATLKALGYTVVSLHDDASEEHLMPTRDNVEAELARICRVAGPDDLIWVHIATHGRLVDGKPVLITRETRAPTLKRRALRLADVEQQMRASGARRLVLTLDACHTGVEVGRDLADPEFIRNAYELAEGFALIAASTAQQVAQEWEAKEHGVFTYHLLEGLKGGADRKNKGFITVSDLTTHTLDGLRHWNVEQGGLLQEPTTHTEGLGDMILADYREQPSGVTNPIRNSMAPNPFGDVGRIVDPDRFFDREDLFRQIFEELRKGVNLSLVGETQVGKSSILSMVQTLGPERMNLPAGAFCYLSMQWVDSEEGFYEALCDTLGIDTCRGYKLHRTLRNKNYVLCLDEIEKMSWDGFTERLRSQLRGLADGPAAPIRLVIASRSPLNVLFPDSPELDSPLAGICRTIDVRLFSPKTARAFIKSRLQGTSVNFTKGEIDTLLRESDGHPAKLQRAAADLYNKKRGA